MTANLVGHFGSWQSEPVAEYRSGQVDRYSAVIYLGSVFGERLPTTFLDNVLRTRLPVIWVADNIDELERRAHNFSERYGWASSVLGHSTVPEVRYKGSSLTRWTRDQLGIMRYANLD